MNQKMPTPAVFAALRSEPAPRPAMSAPPVAPYDRSAFAARAAGQNPIRASVPSAAGEGQEQARIKGQIYH